MRQHVGHKRTFMFLEQLILKHSAHEQCTNIKEIHEGIDFFFGNRAHGQKFVDFLQARFHKQMPLFCVDMLALGAGRGQYVVVRHGRHIAACSQEQGCEHLATICWQRRPAGA